MTPLLFETTYAPVWRDLEQMLAQVERTGQCDGARIATQYRRVCEHLALAQTRAYPIPMIERLENLTQTAHRLIYRQHDWGLTQLAQLLLVDFPQAVRAHRHYLAVATLLFVVPLVVTGWACWRDPGFILHLMDPGQVRDFNEMYSPGAERLGRMRSAGDDFMMFGYYIEHNIGIGLGCFGSGVLGGIGSAFALLYNGVQIGGVGGYLIGAGYALNFLSFVITHGAFELTAVVLAGTAGLRLGWSWIAPGRHTRREALRLAARHAVVLVYGVVALLLVAATLEAFWSSSCWIAPSVKFGVGGGCWLLVLAYLGWQGRPRRADAQPGARMKMNARINRVAAVRARARPDVQSGVQPSGQTGAQAFGQSGVQASAQQQFAQPSAQSGTQSSGQPDAKAFGQSGTQASAQQQSGQTGTQSSAQPSVQPDSKAFGQSGTQSSGQTDAKAFRQSGTQASAQQQSGQTGTQSSAQPSEQSGAQASTQQPAQPDAQSSARPSAQPGAQPHAQSGAQPSVPPHP